MGDHESTGGTWLVRVLNSDSFRRVARTFLFAFLGLLVPGLLGWLHDLTEWASGQGQTPFPDARSLAYLGVAAIGAGFVAVLNGLVVLLEDSTGKGLLRDVPAKATPVRDDRGAVDTRTIAVVALVLAGLVLLVLLL